MINDALKLIRQYHNIDQAQLARKLSIATSYLSEIEAGKKEPTIDLIQKYATFFDGVFGFVGYFSETIAGSQTRSTARLFISKKMLKILKWIANDGHEATKSERKV